MSRYAKASLKTFIVDSPLCQWRVVTLGKINFKKYAYGFSVNLFDRNTPRGYHIIASPLLNPRSHL